MSLPDLIGRSIPLPLPVPDWSKPIILALMLLSIGFGVRTRVTSVRARRLTLEHRALAADLDAMQLALVPEIPSRLGGLALSVAYRPADGPAAGGDFYDAVALDESRVAIILGDVSGHGRTALAHAARMRYTLLAYIEAGLSPREALKLAGSVVGPSGDGSFATVIIAIHDASAASLTYAAAGHPAPLVFGHSVHRPRTNCVSPPLGWGIPCGRRQTILPFAQGARACFFSDGLTEARTEHGLLGRGRVAAMFAELGAVQSASALLDEVQARATQIRDDMAACVIEAERGIAGAGEQSWLEELELDLDQSSLAQGRRFMRGWGLPRYEIDEAITRAHVTASAHGLALLTLALPSRSWAVTPSVAPTIRAARPLRLAAARMASPDLLPTKPACPGDRSHPHPLGEPSVASPREAAR